MKKIFIALVLIFAVSSAFSFTDLYKVNLDLNGNFKKDVAGGKISTDVKTGYSLVTEIPVPLKIGGFRLSAGLEYQLPRDVEGVGQISYFNKYLVFEKSIVANKFHSITPLIKLGQGSASTKKGMGDVDDGLFYGIGVRYKLSSLAFAEITYTVNSGEYLDGDGAVKRDTEYSKINFTWGSKLSPIKNAYDRYSSMH
ncbi:MAG: hypothetical protein WC002_01255 [Candidatus Muiribacteriota bacterium]